MSDWQCVAHNPLSGVSTWIKYEEDGVLVQERQDVSAILDKNKALQNVAEGNWHGDYHRVASIPSSMFYDDASYLGEAIMEDDDKAVAKFLNDSDNSKLRTKLGRV